MNTNFFYYQISFKSDENTDLIDEDLMKEFLSLSLELEDNFGTDGESLEPLPWTDLYPLLTHFSNIHSNILIQILVEGDTINHREAFYALNGEVESLCPEIIFPPTTLWKKEI